MGIKQGPYFSLLDSQQRHVNLESILDIPWTPPPGLVDRMRGTGWAPRN